MHLDRGDQVATERLVVERRFGNPVRERAPSPQRIEEREVPRVVPDDDLHGQRSEATAAVPAELPLTDREGVDLVARLPTEDHRPGGASASEFFDLDLDPTRGERFAHRRRESTYLDCEKQPLEVAEVGATDICDPRRQIAKECYVGEGLKRLRRPIRPDPVFPAGELQRRDAARDVVSELLRDRVLDELQSPVGFVNSGGLVFVDESAEEIPT